MKTQEITTTNLADFGSRERWMLVELLTAWDKQGLPTDFYDDEVVAMMNRNSGCVFLTNSDYQVAMLNGEKLEIWHTCSNCGAEGFRDDFEEAFNEDGECEACAIERNESEEA